MQYNTKSGDRKAHLFSDGRGKQLKVKLRALLTYFSICTCLLCCLRNDEDSKFPTWERMYYYYYCILMHIMSVCLILELSVYCSSKPYLPFLVSYEMIRLVSLVGSISMSHCSYTLFTLPPHPHLRYLRTTNKPSARPRPIHESFTKFDRFLLSLSKTLPFFLSENPVGSYLFFFIFSTFNFKQCRVIWMAVSNNNVTALQAHMCINVSSFQFFLYKVSRH